MSNGFFRKGALGKSHRMARVLYLKKIPLLPKIIKIINRILFSCDIPFKNDIHPTATFGHNGLGVVLNARTPIGTNYELMNIKILT